jgi:valine--tRNA ligase
LKSVQAKLSNEKFVNSAPAQVVENERKKESDTLAKIETLTQSLKKLR